jgi:hypothetical protein
MRLILQPILGVFRFAQIGLDGFNYWLIYLFYSLALRLASYRFLNCAGRFSTKAAMPSF